MEISVNFEGSINLELLDETLRQALPITGISTAPGRITVHVEDSQFQPEMVAQAQTLIAAHNPNALTERQQKQQAQKAQLEVFRAQFLPDSGGGVVSLAALAEKLAWLETEIRDLRGF
jgi:hypothetical protein